jgi:ATP-dependent DNA ligase
MPIKEPFPEWIVPMAATLTQERFAAPEWLFERKLDGIRMLAFKNGSDVNLYSRNRLLQHYPTVAEAVAELLPGVIPDGEAAWDPASRIAYHAFTFCGSRPPVALLPDRPPLLRVCPSPASACVQEVTGDKPWERACRERWEGVIAKLRTSPYEQRRSPHWLKMKCKATQELVVGGFTDPQGSRVGLGALLVGYFDGNDFVFAGKIGTGFNTKLLLELRARLDKLELPLSPFTKAEGLPRVRAHWAKPEIVVQVAFIEWTVHGKLRHPRLVGIRYDKSPREVVRETW